MLTPYQYLLLLLVAFFWGNFIENVVVPEILDFGRNLEERPRGCRKEEAQELFQERQEQERLDEPTRPPAVDGNSRPILPLQQGVK
jgi:hypothetical protein